MNEKTLKALAIKSIMAMLSVILLSALFTEYNQITIFGYMLNKEQQKPDDISGKEENNKNTVAVYKNIETKEIVNSIGNTYLMIKKPFEGTFSVTLQDLYMERKIQVFVSDLDDKVIVKSDITSDGTMGEPLLGVTVSYQYNPDTFLYTAILDIQLDDIYAHCIYEDKQNIYIALLEPHQVYEKIIVVDAGHGGNDIGAYTKDMKFFEKDINLKILLYLKEILDKEDIKVYYTRLTDEKVYLNPRLNLANDLKADMFISIHCNSSEYKSARGSEVLYSTKHQKNLSIKSDKLASVLLEELVSTVNMKSRGIVNGDEIYIIGNAKVPVALIEIGFITNQEELKFLKKKKNQQLIAEGIYNGILKAYEEMEKKPHTKS